MRNRSDRHATNLTVGGVLETVPLLRLAWAECIRARESGTPDERPDICLQSIYPARTLTRCNAGRTIYAHSASWIEGDRHHGQGVDNPAGAVPRADAGPRTTRQRHDPQGGQFSVSPPGQFSMSLDTVGR